MICDESHQAGFKQAAYQLGYTECTLTIKSFHSFPKSIKLSKRKLNNLLLEES